MDLAAIPEALAGDHPCRFVIHDRDSIFSQDLDQSVADMGIRVLRTSVRAPTANAVCEPFGGTPRRECLDFVIPLTERHLNLILQSWVTHYRRADGQYRWLMFRCVPLHDRKGRVVKWYGTNVDIDDRKRAEETLRESESRFRTLVANVADAIYVQDEHGAVVDLNQQGCEGLGYTREESVGTSPRASFCLADQTTIELERKRTAAGETVLDRHCHRRKDGTVFPVEVHCTRFRDGGRSFLLKVVRDISESVRAEEAVRRSEKQLRQVIDTIPAFVWSASPDGSIDFVNRRLLEFSGSPFDQSLGQSWETAIHPDDVDHFREVQRAAIASGDAYEVEARRRRADGQYRWLLFRSAPLHDETGPVVKRYGVGTDIDDRKRAEEALRWSEQRYREVFENASDCIFLLDVTTDGRFKFAGFNPAEEKAVGFANADLCGKFIEDTVPAELFAQLAANYRRCVQTGTLIAYDEALDLPIGRRYFHTTLIPVRDAADRIHRLVGIANDITERKRAEEALGRLNRELRAISNCNQTLLRATDEQSLLEKNLPDRLRRGRLPHGVGGLC